MGLGAGCWKCANTLATRTGTCPGPSRPGTGPFVAVRRSPRARADIPVSPQFRSCRRGGTPLAAPPSSWGGAALEASFGPSAGAYLVRRADRRGKRLGLISGTNFSTPRSAARSSSYHCQAAALTARGVNRLRPQSRCQLANRPSGGPPVARRSQAQCVVGGRGGCDVLGRAFGASSEPVERGPRS